jgi:uncharacterized cupredoxin-like copper-binding protein
MQRSRRLAFLPAVLGLFAIALAACGGTAQSGANVNVKLSEFKVAAAQTEFMAGKTYHFVVTNQGKTDHEFMIVPQGMAHAGMDMHHETLAMIDKIAPGETKTLDYTFSASRDSLEFACYYPGHYEAGMKQSILTKQG